MDAQDPGRGVECDPAGWIAGPHVTTGVVQQANLSPVDVDGAHAIVRLHAASHQLVRVHSGCRRGGLRSLKQSTGKNNQKKSP